MIYVTGHRNPDSDSIASAIAYAELKRRLEPGERYLPVRLGELNQQSRWLLERSGGAPEPEFLPHIYLRVVRRDARDLSRPSPTPSRSATWVSRCRTRTWT